MQHVAFMYSKDFSSSDTDNLKTLIKSASIYRPNFDKNYALELVKKFKIDVKKPLYKLSKGKQFLTQCINDVY